MTELRLTDAQRSAIDTLDSDVSVSAGAGSGKTEVLVQRFCRIVESGMAEVDEILTVTFTEKAAKEMKQRIVREFERLYLQTGETRFEQARRKVESAYIGTIHSFATRVLKENAFDAGIDPKFDVLEQVEAATLRDKILEELIAANYADQTSEYLALLFAFGKRTVKSSIGKAHAHLCNLGKRANEIPPISAQDDNPRDLADACFQLLDELLVLSGQVRMTEKLLEQLEDFSPKYDSLKESAFQACAKIQDLTPQEYVSSFDCEEYEALGLMEYFVKGSVGTAEVRENYIKPARYAAKLFRQSLLAPIAAYYVQCLLKITDDFQRDYAEAKWRAGMMDYDDLLLITKKLLTIGDGDPTEIAESYKRKFRFVVMDEFQDTNALQKSIVQSVCRPGRFFTVGDVKQSIFSFIHSDVSVFIDHHDSIEQNGNGKTLAFQENFRSRPDILEFVNWFFDQIWAEDGDFDFEKLIAGGKFHDKTDSDVEILFVPQMGGAKTSRLLEARAIAKRILELLGRTGRPPLMVTKKKDDDSPPRPLRPGDILILFRAVSDIPIYERALHEAGIEYYVVSGRGFYSTHEAQDILNLLRVIENPLNDVPMAAMLRSPMVGISDDTLWWLTRRAASPAESPEIEMDETDIPQRNQAIGKLYSALQNLDSISGIGRDDIERLVRFKGTLNELHSFRSESKITTLLDTALARTEYDLKALASHNGKRKYANIRKLLDVAQDFEANSIFSLGDFIRYMENLAILADREAEAPTETEESPVVRLMTVHKAKGLQAPVVFVTDCARKLNVGDSSAFVFSKERGVSCKIPNPATGAELKPRAYETISEQIKTADIEEEKRLLYVALTRAEELLILSGSSKFDAEKRDGKAFNEIGSWSGWIEKALQLDENRGQTLEAGGVNVRLRADLPELQPANAERKTVLETHRKTLLAGEKLPDVDLEIAQTIVARCSTLSPSACTGPMELTVSKALDFLTCPLRYQRRYILGIPEPEPEWEDYPPDEEDGTSAANVGSAAHQILRSVDFTKDISPQLEEYARYQDEAVRDTALESCRRLLNSPWLSRIQSGSSWLQEVPFQAHLDQLRLLGRIDLLFKDQSGWIIIDYKTGSGEGGERYNLQVGIYALAIERCLGVAPMKVALVNLGKGEDVEINVTAELLDQTRRLLEAIPLAVRSGAFPARKSSECDYCGYGKGCQLTVDG